MPSRCCEFVDSRLRRSPPDRASAVPMDKPGKTQCVSPTLPTGRRLPHKLHSTPQQHEMILISGNGEISSRLHAFSLFLPETCPNNRDHRREWIPILRRTRRRGPAYGLSLTTFSAGRRLLRTRAALIFSTSSLPINGFLIILSSLTSPRVLLSTYPVTNKIGIAGHFN